MRLFETSPCRPIPEGLPPSQVQHRVQTATRSWHNSLRLFEACACTPTSEGLPPSQVKHRISKNADTFMAQLSRQRTPMRRLRSECCAHVSFRACRYCTAK